MLHANDDDADCDYGGSGDMMTGSMMIVWWWYDSVIMV